MLLARKTLQHINSIVHEGKVLVFSTDSSGDIYYTIKQDGFEDSYGNTDVKGWENWNLLELPGRRKSESNQWIEEQDDRSVIDKEKQELTQQDDNGNIAQDSNNQPIFILKSRYRTYNQSAVTPVQLVSAMGHLYVFRQSTSNTLLVDRFVLDGMTNKLVRKLEVRFKRSQQKYALAAPSQNNGREDLSKLDSLDFRDIYNQPFYEPTTELSLVKNLDKGWFSVVLVPTSEVNKFRWHIFAYNSESKKVELTSIRASDEGLFDIKDYTVMEPKPDGSGGLVPRSVAGVIQRSLDLRDKTGSVQVSNGLTATVYTNQVERQTEEKDEQGQYKTQLLKESVRVMLVVPTNRGYAAALSFTVAQDGTLSQIDDRPQIQMLRSNARDMLLPLNTLDEVKAIASTPPPQGSITKLSRTDEDQLQINSDQPATIDIGDTVKLKSTPSFNGHYVINKIDDDTFEVESNSQLGQWQMVPKQDILVFDGMITAFEQTTDGKLLVTCPDHGLDNRDEVQITDTGTYDGTYSVTEVDTTQFTIDLKWKLGGAINLKKQSDKRRGVAFTSANDYITTPDLNLNTPSQDAVFEETYSAWVYVTSRTSGQQLLMGRTKNSTQQAMQLVIGEGKVGLNVTLNTRTERIEDPLLIPLEVWVHYAGVFSYNNSTNLAQLTLCRNGQVVATQVFQRKALVFDGQNDGIEVSNAAPLNPKQAITIEALICPLNSTGERRILQKGTGNSNQYRLMLQNGNFVFRVVGANGNNFEITTPIAGLNQWQYVAGVYDLANKVMRIWVNGTLKNESSLSDPQSIRASNEPLYIGARATSVNLEERFLGQIAEIRLWNKARTQAEMDADRNTVLSGKEPGLVGYWEFSNGFNFGPFSYTNRVDGSPNFIQPLTFQGVDWSKTIQIGGKADASSANGFTGKIADVQVWNQARTPQEIEDSMYLQLTGKEVDLMGYWRLGGILEGQTRLVPDFSSYGNEGTVHGNAFVSAITLNRNLENGTPVIRYSNDDLFAVTQRATYIESFEFKVNPVPATPPNGLFEFAYWGQRNRSSEQCIPFVGVTGDVEKLSEDWYRASARFTVPDDVNLVRLFEISKISGNWTSLEIRKHRIRLVSDTVTCARYTDAPQLTTLADQTQTLARLLTGQTPPPSEADAETLIFAKGADLKTGGVAFGLTRLEKMEAELLLERRRIQDRIIAIGNIDAIIATQQSLVDQLQGEYDRLQGSWQQESNNPLNYWCRLRAKVRHWSAARIYTQNYRLIQGGEPLDGKWGESQGFFFRFVQYPPVPPSNSPTYAIYCMLEKEQKQVILDIRTDGSDLIYGNPDNHLRDNQKWRVEPLQGTDANNYVISSVWGSMIMDLDHESGNTVHGWRRYHGGENQRWWIEKIQRFGETTGKVAAAARLMRDKELQLQQEQRQLDALRGLSRDVSALNQRLTEITERQLPQLQSALDHCNTQFLDGINTTKLTPQVMGICATDSRKLVTTGAFLGFIRSSSRLSVLETCEGNVQVSYIDGEQRMRQTQFDATSDSRNTSYEQWIPDALRTCLDFNSKDKVIRLNEAIALGGNWTVETWFVYPLPDTRPSTSVDFSTQWNTLLGSADLQIRVHQGQKLGIWVNNAFKDSGYNLQLQSLLPGWHHLAVARRAADKGSTTPYYDFYLDGKWVAQAGYTPPGNTGSSPQTQSVNSEGGVSTDSEAILATLRPASPIESDNIQLDAKTINNRTLLAEAEITSRITHIGNHPDGSQQFGKLAEVRLWYEALSAEEIEINSKTVLTGNEPGLAAYYPLSEAQGDVIHDYSGSNYHGTAVATWFACAAPIGKLDTSYGALISTEYVTYGLDTNSRKIAMMRRFLALPLLNGGVSLFSGKRIEELELQWIGNAQWQPTLVGYIEGAPPVPSENLTEKPSYSSATSVELATTDDVSFSWRREETDRFGISASFLYGVEDELTIVDKVVWKYKFGIIGDLSMAYGLSNQTNVTATDKIQLTDRLELRGTQEQTPKFKHLGKRFIPKNVGYALVVSGTADVYITRLARSGKMVSYLVQPNPAIPLDVNTITFLMNPAYTMNGSLDGLTGSSATSDRFFRHVPAMRRQYGSLYPASYYRILEAYDLKQKIEAQDKARESYFENFNSRLVDKASLDREIGEVQKPEEANDPKDEQNQADKERAEALKSKIQDQQSLVHATKTLTEWQRKMEELQIKAGKRNIVNTYVWDADGGLRTESQQFTSTIEHTIGSSFTLDTKLGIQDSYAIFGVATDLKLQATLSMSQTMSKTERRSRGFALNVNLSGVESTGVTNYNDIPLLPGEKVDRYRFMSFFLEGKTEHFHHFFNTVVDPEWLQSNDEEARALRQTQSGKPNPAWRILHRVTYVERPALMSFGQDIRKLPAADPPTDTKKLLDRIGQLEAKNRTLEEKIDRMLELLQSKQTP